MQSNYHKTYDQRLAPDVPYEKMTNFSSKFNNAATTIMNNDRYKGGQPWSTRTEKWNQEQYREPMNKFGYRFLEDTSEVQRYAPGGMLGQLHAGASTGSEMRTLPVKPKYNMTV